MANERARERNVVFNFQQINISVLHTSNNTMNFISSPWWLCGLLLFGLDPKKSHENEDLIEANKNTNTRKKFHLWMLLSLSLNLIKIDRSSVRRFCFASKIFNLIPKNTFQQLLPRHDNDNNGVDDWILLLWLDTVFVFCFCFGVDVS